jgi:hypothetical protein
MSEKDELNQIDQPQVDDSQPLESVNTADPGLQPNDPNKSAVPDRIGMKFSLLRILLLAFASVAFLYSLTLNIVHLLGSGEVRAYKLTFIK